MKPSHKPAAGPLTHFDAAGQAHMVDVGAKTETTRVAKAQGHIRMAPATFALIESGSAKKGDVLGIARIAAGVHWPTDVLGGIAVGILGAIVGYLLIRGYRPVALSHSDVEKTTPTPVSSEI